MEKYIAFLRGINVGNIRIKMTDLKLAFEEMGFQEVKTYLQTGNVVFLSDKSLSETKVVLEAGLGNAFNYEAFVLLYPFSVLSSIIAGYPMVREEGYHAYVLFIETREVFEELKKIVFASQTEEESFAFGDQVIYWKVLRQQTLESPFSKAIAKKKYKAVTTMRNTQTLEKMV